MKKNKVKKVILVALLVVALLVVTSGIAIAIWEDTKETQVTAVILPLPEGTFHFTSSLCSSAAVGFEGQCYAYIFNDSPTLLTVDAMTVTTSHPHITIEIGYGVGMTIDPQQQDNVFWNYLSDPECEPGEITFDVEVTCSGD